MIIVAIDPGMDGGICISANDPTLGYPVVTLNLTHDTLREFVLPGRLVVVEGVGTAGNHKLQQSFGESLGWALGNRCKTYVVPPQVWQLPLRLKAVSYHARKSELYRIAQETCNEVTKSQADAYLIMRWAYNQPKERLARYEYS